MTSEKIFQNNVLCQNTGQETEKTEVFDFWSENFCEVHLKETVMKPFFSLVVSCNFIEKELHRSYFPVS